MYVLMMGKRQPCSLVCCVAWLAEFGTETEMHAFVDVLTKYTHSVVASEY